MPLVIFLPYILIEGLAFYGLSMLIGVGWALLALVATFFVGLFLAAWQMRAIGRAAASQRMGAGQALGNYGLTAAGAILVALPGFVTAIIGLLLILPPTRAVARTLIGRKLRSTVEDLGVRGFQATNAYRQQASYGRLGTDATGTGAAATGSSAGSPASRTSSDDAEIIDLDDNEIRVWSDNLEPEDFTEGPGDHTGKDEPGGDDDGRGPAH